VASFVVENRVWQKDELLPRDALRALQFQRLQELLRRVVRVPFYRGALAKAAVAPEDVRTLDDLRRLPLTTKADFRENYPLGLLAVPREKVARIHGSSGTTGKPTFVAYTAQDRETWADLCARFLVAGGLRQGHTVHICFGYGLFTGGFGLHYGVEKAGATVVPAGSGNTQRQVMLIRDLQADVLVCTPSYALNIAEVAAEAGIEPRKLGLKFGHFGAEPWTEDMRVKIEGQLGLLAFDNYGLSEVVGPGVSGECAVRDGMHVQEDHFLVECLDPDSLEPVPPGEQGELVFTTLTKQAMPVIRFRTRDITRLYREECPCGRPLCRMERVSGRTDDMLIIRGINVFPSQIEAILLGIEGTQPHYQIVVDRRGSMDDMEVQVEVQDSIFSDKVKELEAFERKVRSKIESVLGLTVRVKLLEPGSIERSMGKAKRVIDQRKK